MNCESDGQPDSEYPAICTNLPGSFFHAMSDSVRILLSTDLGCRSYSLYPQESYDMPEIVEARCRKSTVFCTQYESEGWYTRIDPNPESDSPGSGRRPSLDAGTQGLEGCPGRRWPGCMIVLIFAARKAARL